MTPNKTIGLLGTGIFLCLTLQGFSFLSFTILEEILLFSPLSPMLIYGISAYGTLLFELLLFVYALKRIKKIDLDQPPSLKRVFWTFLIAFIFTQVLSFLQPMVSSLYLTEMYYNLKQTYYEGLREHYAVQSFAIDTPVWTLKYVIMALLILKDIKYFKDTI
ncbi:hypothetical protein SAMN05216474_0471 [Lishizhenia tianjinensis]|uniref:Uncharacterized protein n=1 Tax=Lishizhenia tianjinensis TaxID=477690 RepID=A0A1I6XW20_9FLAO|nr:hypothetical protein [Lishizhenia tianjinensis]SFT42172.1 hypothetical protein SAMN05216474_0471 [Lishizhenia tianjinensis]